MPDYRIWTPLRKPGYCSLKVLEGFDEPWDLVLGKPLKARFPEGVRFHMNSSSPKDMKLGDAHRNPHGAAVISKKLAGFLQLMRVPAVEYLPISIVNHKGRVASQDYFILNVLAIQDCLDLERSQPIYNKIDTTSIDAVQQVVLDEAKIDPALPLFRPKDFSDLLLVEGKLADALEAQAFTNVKFKPLSEYEP